MLRHLTISFLISFPFFGNAFGQSADEIRLIFGGDIMIHSSQYISAYDSLTKEYLFGSYFTDLKGLFRGSDIVAANLETTLASGQYAGYPRFRSPDNLAHSLANDGFNLLFTSNNHSLDQGAHGLARTIRVLNHHNILHTGTFISPEEKDLLHPLLVEVRGTLVAFLNYSYGLNLGKGNSDVLVNQIDQKQILEDIRMARQRGADFIIAYMHWGDEYQEKPNTYQKEIADLMMKEGVKLIIGSHPHVVQPVVVDSTGGQIHSVCAYSLGNLISNQRSGKKKEGLILEVILKTSGEKIEIDQVIKHPTYVVRTGKKDQYQYRITLPASHVPI